MHCEEINCYYPENMINRQETVEFAKFCSFFFINTNEVKGMQNAVEEDRKLLEKKVNLYIQIIM